MWSKSSKFHTLERMKENLLLDYEHCAQSNPRNHILFKSSRGMGQTGPYRNRKAYDFHYSGCLWGGVSWSFTGELDGPPLRSGLMFARPSGGAMYAILFDSVRLMRERKRERKLNRPFEWLTRCLSFINRNAGE